MTVDSQLARRVRGARERLAWSRETLAHHAGVSWAAVTQIEAGRRTNIRPVTLAALASALGVTSDYLLGRPPLSLFDHRALLFGSPEEFAAAAGRYVRERIERSDETLIVAARTNIALLKKELGATARNVRFEDAARWYRSPVHALTLYRRYMDDRLGSGCAWLSIIGEPVWDARAAGVPAWLTYETILAQVFAAAPVTAVCAYATTSDGAMAAETARLTHPRLMSDEGTLANPQYRGLVDHALDLAR